MYFLGLFFLTVVFLKPMPLIAQKTTKLFTSLSAEQTNIHFTNQLEDTKNHNILIYSNYYGGAGVGVGDVNNDGLPDVFFAGNLVADKLYLNQGDFSFTDIAAVLEENNCSRQPCLQNRHLLCLQSNHRSATRAPASAVPA